MQPNSEIDNLALTHLRDSGYPVLGEDVARLHPYWYAHINVQSHYTFRPPAWTGRHRPLRDPGNPDDEG